MSKLYPRVKDGRVDQRLTNVALAVKSRFYAQFFLPTITVDDDSGLIPVLGDAHLRRYNSTRAMYDRERHEVAFKIDEDKEYKLKYRDLAIYLPDRLTNQERMPFDMQAAAQMTVIDALDLERDIELSALISNTSVITNNITLSGTDQFNDGANSDPVGAITDGILSVQRATGIRPNSMSLSFEVAAQLAKHPAFFSVALAAVSGGAGKSQLSREALVETLKSQFALDRVIITEGISVSSPEGQNRVISSTWEPDVLLYYAPASPSLFAPSFGYSFRAAQSGRTVVQRDHNDKGEWVEHGKVYEDKILMPEAAYLIKDAVAV